MHLKAYNISAAVIGWHIVSITSYQASILSGATVGPPVNCHFAGGPTVVSGLTGAFFSISF